MTISKERIEALLAEADPEGLIAMGCPDDEYAPEAEALSQRLLPGGHAPKSAEELTQVLQSIFDRMFEGCGGGPRDYGPVGQEIWDEHQKLKERIAPS